MIMIVTKKLIAISEVELVIVTVIGISISISRISIMTIISAHHPTGPQFFHLFLAPSCCMAKSALIVIRRCSLRLSHSNTFTTQIALLAETGGTTTHA